MGAARDELASSQEIRALRLRQMFAATVLCWSPLLMMAVSWLLYADANSPERAGVGLMLAITMSAVALGSCTLYWVQHLDPQDSPKRQVIVVVEAVRRRLLFISGRPPEQDPYMKLHYYAESYGYRALQPKTNRLFGWGLSLSAVVAVAISTFVHQIGASWWWLLSSAIPLLLAVLAVARLHARRQHRW